MTAEQIANKYKDKFYFLRMGAGKLAKRLHTDKATIYKAKEIIKEGIEVPVRYVPRVLLLDTETAPIEAYVFNLWKQNIAWDHTNGHWFMLCWTAKWLYEDEVISMRLSGEEAINEDDSRIMKGLWELLDEADIVIAHNGCVQKDTPVLCADFVWRKAGDLKPGDRIVAFEEGLPPGETLRDKNGKWKHRIPLSKTGGKPSRGRHVKLAIVTANKIERHSAMKVVLSDGTSVITTIDHWWLAQWGKDHTVKWKQTCKLKPGDRIHRMCKPWNIDKSYEAAWMSAFIDSEGTLGGCGESSIETCHGTYSNLQWCQRPTAVFDRAELFAEKLGINRFSYLPKNNWGLGKGDCIYTNTKGGKWETMRLIGSLDLVKLKPRVNWDEFGPMFTNKDEILEVVSVELCEPQEFAILETSTHTYIADGFPMHNCKADIPWINTRFIMNGLNPPRPYHIVDTLQVARKKFGFMSNKLDALCEYFGFPHKLETDFDLWRRCVKGDEEALKYMCEYNKNDVKMLELVYLKLLPWIPNHPAVGNLVDSDEPICAHCGSNQLEKIDGFYTTNVSKYELFRCKHCGTVVRGRKNLNKRGDVPIVSINR